MNNKYPYLIQRLKKPFKVEGPMKELSNSFSFGGGKVNGGLSNEAWKILSQIWRYDYMGSAEFEYGALPKSFTRIVDNCESYEKAEIDVKVKSSDLKIADVKVYIFSKKEDTAEAKEWIKKFANARGEGFHTKERVCLIESIHKPEFYKDIVGWHDIDNDFLFFTDKEMFENFTNLFNI